MLLLSELVQLAASLAVRLLGLRCDPRVTVPSPAVLVCCSCGALEDPREAEVSALLPFPSERRAWCPRPQDDAVGSAAAASLASGAGSRAPPGRCQSNEL